MTGLVWLASYPKSGNTWLRLFLESLATGGGPIDINQDEGDRPSGGNLRTFFDDWLGVDSADLLCDEAEAARPRLYEAMARDWTDPKPLKVHDAYTLTSRGEPLFPAVATAGVLYVVRDPRDVAVSLAHHLNITIDRAIEGMADPRSRFGQGDDRHYARQLRQRLLSWNGHVTSWLESGLPLHLVRYEDMVASPEATFAAIARFIGPAPQAEALAGAIAATRFSTLQAQEAAAGFIERPARSVRFFRRGTAGGWRTALTPEQARQIEQDHGAVMTRLGYR